MKTGNAIASVATPIARTLGMGCIDPETKELRPESNCAKMRQDFNNAQYPQDYLNAVLDRIRKRGKYSASQNLTKENNANQSH